MTRTSSSLLIWRHVRITDLAVDSIASDVSSLVPPPQSPSLLRPRWASVLILHSTRDRSLVRLEISAKISETNSSRGTSFF